MVEEKLPYYLQKFLRKFLYNKANKEKLLRRI